MRSENKMVATFAYFEFISALVILSSSNALSEHANNAIKNSRRNLFIVWDNFYRVRGGK